MRSNTAQLQSIEHATMLQCANRLIGMISADPLSVACKLLQDSLVTEDLVAKMLLPSKTGHEKATELVLHVTSVVKNSPEKFGVFMRALSSFLWLGDCVESVQRTYDAMKARENQEGARESQERARENQGSARESQESASKVSILDPFVTLQWNKEGPYPLPLNTDTQCVVLNNSIYATAKVGDSAMISAISADLKKWRKLKTPDKLEDFALTVHHSNLVLVGGRKGSTPTNKLWTSNAGDNWILSSALPPMPTSRYSSTAVNTGTPECLIVAGGIGDSGTLGGRMDTVEVLVETVWWTAEPLPKACTSMKYAIHEGTLYLMGGSTSEGMKDVYSCIIRQSPHESHSSQWNWHVMPQVPSQYSCPSSFGGHLLAIGGQPDHISGYSAEIFALDDELKKWVHAGDLPKALRGATAITLPTGNLAVIGGFCKSGNVGIRNQEGFVASLKVQKKCFPWPILTPFIPVPGSWSKFLGMVLVHVLVSAVLVSLWFPQKADDEKPLYTEVTQGNFLPPPKAGTAEFQFLEEYFCPRVELILQTVHENEFYAATTYLEKPGEIFSHPVAFPKGSMVVGMFAGKRTALIQTKVGEYVGDFVEEAIKSFPNALYVIGVGGCYSLDRAQYRLGDVIVSERISNLANYKWDRDGRVLNQGDTVTVVFDLLRIFCQGLKHNPAFQVSTNDRYSKVHSGNIISHPHLIDNKEIRDKLHDEIRTAIGGEMEGGELLKFVRKGKIKGIIVIKGVYNYANGQEASDWQYTATLASLSYTKSKLEFEPPLIE